MHKLATAATPLLPAATCTLPNCLVGQNYFAVNDTTMQQFSPTIYDSKTYSFDSVDLLQMPPNATIYPTRESILSVDGIYVKEQIPGKFAYKNLDDIVSATTARKTVRITDPCLLINRWGIQTWGHWLGEIFPKIVLAENNFPGRFLFLMPQDVFNISSPRTVWNSIWECFRTLGIGRERILQLYYDNQYIFSNLYLISNVFNENKFHPMILQTLRDALASWFSGTSSSAMRRIAILRTESSSRNIDNVAAIIRILEKREFEFVEIGRIPFIEQVHLFSSTKLVVGVLASGLTGLFFSPQAVQLVSLAPTGYANAFFVPIVKQLNGQMYDVRGQITRMDPRNPIFSNFSIDPEHVDTALNTLLR
jgi:hypothetical protein